MFRQLQHLPVSVFGKNSAWLPALARN